MASLKPKTFLWRRIQDERAFDPSSAQALEQLAVGGRDACHFTPQYLSNDCS